jgi:flagellin
VPGTYTGGVATASSIATQINSAIDAATANGATNVAADAGAVAVANADGTITITNNHRGADHAMSDLSTSTATFKGANTAVAGANRSGSDLASYLNGLFAASTALAPAQLTAVWTTGGGTAGTVQIVSGNGTSFRLNSGTTATASMTTSTTALPGGGIDFGANAAAHQAFQISVDNGATWGHIVLGTATTTRQGIVDALNAQFTAQSVGATATLSGNYVNIASNAVGAGATVQIQNYSAADQIAGYSNALAAGKILGGLTTGAVTSDQNIGFGVSGSGFTGTQATGLNNVAAPANHMIDAGGASSLNITTSGVTSAVTFNSLVYGNDSQAITITANDANGAQQSKTITLKNNTSTNTAGSNIDQAISYINAQLQQSNNATLQKIVAVKENNASTNQINFISSLASFNVGVGSTGNADGVNGGVSNNYAVGVVGAGANIAIDTQAGAQAAVTAVSSAVSKLGSAQAAIGKGENQLSYAISLAQSQITNQSAAESYIRDANVAQQAANLTKAQVLQQASIAAMAQANSAPQAVLALLRV